MLDKTGIAIRSIPTELGRNVGFAVNVWESFCLLPTGNKEQFNLKMFETDWIDPGYFRKKSTDGHDEKEYFHILSSITAILMQAAGHRSMSVGFFYPARADNFVCGGTNLCISLSSCVGDELVTGLTVDQKLDYEIQREVAGSIDIMQIRFLKYPAGKVGDVIAQPHPDKSGLTIHLWSSHPGLQYTRKYSAKDPKGVVWEDLYIPGGSVAIFGGHQSFALSKGTIRPLIHRVVQRDTGGEPRYSVVAFIPFLGVPRSPKGKRLQEMMAELGY